MEDARNKLSAPETGIKSPDWIRGVVQVLGLALTLGFGMHAQAQINGADIRTIVRISTNVGDFSVGLYDEATPETVANFLWYVNEGHYNQTYIHRTENVTAGDFQVVQGGGFRFQPFFGTIEIPTQGPVRNEPVFSNVRGTIAMAKFSGEPDSATNQWYFNLSDNSESLDTNSGGFTVFGEVLGGEAGMEVLDAIMGLQKVDFHGSAESRFWPSCQLRADSDRGL
jgi:peptidyl-prolyl cis-trans isomerase A (cyclophilin A)